MEKTWSSKISILLLCCLKLKWMNETNYLYVTNNGISTNKSIISIFEWTLRLMIVDPVVILLEVPINIPVILRYLYSIVCALALFVSFPTY